MRLSPEEKEARKQTRRAMVSFLEAIRALQSNAQADGGRSYDRLAERIREREAEREIEAEKLAKEGKQWSE